MFREREQTLFGFNNVSVSSVTCGVFCFGQRARFLERALRGG